MTLPPKLGQHWLRDEAVLKSIVGQAEISNDDTILEVGPGQGVLTDKLAVTGARVMAVELDRALAKKLNKTYQDSSRITVINQDIREFDLSELPANYKVVANIPYYLTAPLIKKLLTSQNPPSRLILLVQKEVAERLAAEPGDMSILSVATQLFGQVQLVQTVPASAFSPPPKVTSAIVVIKRKGNFKVGQDESIMSLVRHGFANRRKTLVNSLSAGLMVDKAQIHRALKGAGLPSATRAQALNLNDWRKLNSRIKEIVE